VSKLKRWIFRIVILIFGFVILTLLFGFAYEEVGRIRDKGNLPQRIGTAVDIGGRSLNIYCAGEGSPTVIFETGGNGPGLQWSVEQGKVAKFTRACWYDRAGVGWSDPPPSPRTSTTIVNDLHALLSRAGVQSPYVFVGASIGGEYALIYAGHYPQEVAGMVLADSSHPDQQEPAFMTSAFNRMSQRARVTICTALPFMSRFGILRFLAPRMSGPPSSEATPEGRILAKLNARPEALKVDAEQTCAATDEGRLIPERGTGNLELDNAARSVTSLGDMPLIVLTAGKFWAPPGLEKQSAEYHEIWVHQLQSALARLSSRGQQVIVDAHHDMAEAPDAVVMATQSVVNEVRAEKR
jgi:pimeloyl-ACP methyl ester carboxylesterase